MNRILLVVCVLVVVLTSVAGQTAFPAVFSVAQRKQTWRRYTVKDGDFSVSLPTMPVMISSIESERRFPKVGWGRHLRTSLLEDVTYGIDVFDNPNRQSLDEFVAEYKAAARDNVMAEQNVAVNGVPGKQYLIRDVPALMQFFATERRRYRFTVRGADADNPAVKQFFSSIVLGKEMDAVVVSDNLFQ